LIEVPDADLFRWLTGAMATPSNYDSPLLRRLKAFHAHDAAVHG
jgi:antitoxin CptB